MDLGAWCGHCGESFRLAELTEGGFDGRCPRCGKDLAPGYVPVASAAVHDVLGKDCPDAKSLGEVPIRGYERPMGIWQLG